jgi:hypothetical protein
MTGERDLVGDLALLCRAAAEAGEDWRARLEEEWVPRALAGQSPARIEAALASWFEGGARPADPAAAVEAAVVAAMADDGYD